MKGEVSVIFSVLGWTCETQYLKLTRLTSVVDDTRVLREITQLAIMTEKKGILYNYELGESDITLEDTGCVVMFDTPTWKDNGEYLEFKKKQLDALVKRTKQWHIDEG